MLLEFRPTGLGPGSARTGLITSSLPASGRSAASTKRAAVLTICAGFWSMTVNGPMTRSDRVATLEEAKAQFQKSWDAWKAWAKLEEVPYLRLARLLRCPTGADFL